MKIIWPEFRSAFGANVPNPPQAHRPGQCGEATVLTRRNQMTSDAIEISPLNAKTPIKRFHALESVGAAASSSSALASIHRRQQRIDPAGPMIQHERHEQCQPSNRGLNEAMGLSEFYTLKDQRCHA